MTWSLAAPAWALNHKGERRFAGHRPLTLRGLARIRAGSYRQHPGPRLGARDRSMKVRSSLKSLKTRHRDCKLVRRKGVVYVINKTDPRFKAKQG